MMISVQNAYANNLKNISVNIPIGKITAITGVSGSGKSTLLKDILGAYGAQNFVRISSKTVQDALLISRNIDVKNIEHLPNTILIDVNNSVSNPISTVSTISGIHEILRNLFLEYGSIRCEKCGNVVCRDYTLIRQLEADLRFNASFDAAVEYIEKNGSINKIEFFDKNGKNTKNNKKKALATVYFQFNNPTEKLVHDFNNQFGCSIVVTSDTAGVKYDFIKEIECSACHSVGANLIRSRLSYNTSYEDGGGSCRLCGGTGTIAKIKTDCVFPNSSKGIFDGASPFITEKGIKYSTITEKFLTAVYQELGLDVRTPIDSLPEKEFNAILYGWDKEISFKDRVGGKKTQIFKGVVNYLNQSYQMHKGGESLAKLFDTSDCPDCACSRFDRSISRFTFCDESMPSLMMMTLFELGEWCKKKKNSAPINARPYLDKIINETYIFNQLSCGHLSLYRASRTLSGGEIQRIRMGALLNAGIHGLCYLLDEPSSGLHYSDIECLSILLRSICNRGNTIIMVEHNIKMLRCCDYIVDMGPHGGNRGGNVLFSDSMSNIKDKNSATAHALFHEEDHDRNSATVSSVKKDYLLFKNLAYNNLKHISVKFPKNAYTVVCGVSGSGKSTLVKCAVYDSVNSNPSKYGFKKVDFLEQTSKVASRLSTVSSIVDIGNHIAKLYERASKGKIKRSSFLIGSSDGKCRNCGGKGMLFSATDEWIGVCDSCNGYGFNDEVLDVKVDGLNIHDLYNTNLEELNGLVTDAKINKLVVLAIRLGIGYLALSRMSKTLSKGELQRVSLMRILASGENHHLIILDEPSKGLHTSDTSNLVDVCKEIALAGNTLLAVEHNPEMIRNADYMIELGGTGADGGRLLFQGNPSEIKDTPTAKMLNDLESGENSSQETEEIRITIQHDRGISEYVPHHLYFEQKYAEALMVATQKARQDFLSVAIPNNSMFARIGRCCSASETPIMLAIDFNERLKYNISVSESLGIRSILTEQAVDETGKQIARYVFDPDRLTGKCATCKGTGKVWMAEEEFFMEGGALSPICKNFLKNSTDYLKFIKLLQKDKIDISKPIADMSDTEKQILFWGYETQYAIDEKSKRWEGIIPYFIQYHNHYKDRSADTMFKMRKEIPCPVCGGKRLKALYQSYKCFDLSFKDWMSLAVDTLLKKIKFGLHSERLSQIKERLETLSSLTLGGLTLGTELLALSAMDAAKIKLLSFYFNRIYGAGIVVKNIASTDQKDQIREMLEKLSKETTVWIV